LFVLFEGKCLLMCLEVLIVIFVIVVVVFVVGLVISAQVFLVEVLEEELNNEYCERWWWRLCLFSIFYDFVCLTETMVVVW
jgi:hypothetical protein